MSNQRILFVTQRGLRHQQAALAAAPPGLKVIMCRTGNMRDVVDLLPDADFLISERTGGIDAAVIAAGKNLKLIQRLGSQVWDIDTDAARRAGIPVCYLPVKTCKMVAEHMVLMMLGLARHVRALMHITAEAKDWGKPPKRCNEDYFAFNWSNRQRITPLGESTVGILGLGEIGTELARLLKGFGCTVLYNKRRPLPAAVEIELGMAHASREDLARRSDFVCCLLPNLPENNQSVGADFFGQMKRGGCLVHCGAPGVLNEIDLIAALRSGQLGGGAIDCFTYEPMRPDDPLLELARDPHQNLILTPHVAAGTVAASAEERVTDFANIIAFLKGEKLRHRLV